MRVWGVERREKKITGELPDLNDFDGVRAGVAWRKSLSCPLCATMAAFLWGLNLAEGDGKAKNANPKGTEKWQENFQD